MANNFVILYQSREGSTAIINSLSWQAGVRIPLVEELDDYLFLRHHPMDQLYEVLDHVFATGAYGGAPMAPDRLRPSDATIRYDVVGFKWRLFGDISQVARVFEKHRVMVFVLSRTDFLELVSSTYIHDNANYFRSDVAIGNYPQFTALRLSGAKKQAFLEKLSAFRFPMNPRLFFKTVRRRLRLKSHQLQIIRILSRADIPIRHLSYEAFDADPETTIKWILAEIGLPADRKFEPNCDFVKVHAGLNSDRIDGIKTLSRGIFGARFWLAKRRYSHTLRQIDSLTARDQLQ